MTETLRKAMNHGKVDDDMAEEFKELSDMEVVRLPSPFGDVADDVVVKASPWLSNDLFRDTTTDDFR